MNSVTENVRTLSASPSRDRGDVSDDDTSNGSEKDLGAPVAAAFESALKLSDPVPDYPTPSAPISFKLELFLAMHGESPDRYLRRFLRARKWAVADTIDMIIKTLRYIHASRHLPSDLIPELTRKLIILHMELACMMTTKSVETITMIFDMDDFALLNNDMAVVQFLVTTFQNFYPERLGMALVVGAPWLFSGVWEVVKLWLDPVVASKVHFIRREELEQHISPEEIVEVMGGTLPNYAYRLIDRIEKDGIAAMRESANKQKLWAEYHAAIDAFVKKTEAWAVSDEGDSIMRAHWASQIELAYKGLAPLVRCPTNYQRFGVFDDPVFDTIVTKRPPKTNP
eukprot:jgi/Hompol1/5711/HPOL_002418-RA